ncbi:MULTISPECIES: ATP-binding protein [unclassified Motilimonas]|uniref:ATP-binding protein n=1 Tax=Motilimonas TaxID=1914248 RepID=UPI001E4343EA|nr:MULTISPECIES: ATP-binding protein [unclassified Motilimonas]MCE0558219.1 type IV pili methyl-accepting chemotaxis transducer N-terminal domain-containing protein [Motilimonas sp. E26]MDO6526399.1 ATP-binding protein [Motilimonas sp. 1_MG-2023]
MLLHDLGKYRGIVAAITLFLVLDTCVLALNYFVSKEIQQETESVNLAGRQGMLTQKLLKSLYELQDDLAVNLDVTDNFQEFADTFELFDVTLVALKEGGMVPVTDINDTEQIEVQPVNSEAAMQSVDAGLQLWQQYREILGPIINNGSEQVSLLDIHESIATVKETNATLLTFMNDLTRYMEQQANEKTQMLQYVELAAVVAAILNFFVIMFIFVGRLKKNDEQLELSQKENAEILGTVKEGLFLLDQELIIGSQYSQELVNIFGRQDLDGKKLAVLLKDMVSDSELQLSEDYIGLLFKEHVNENLIQSLNPLKQIEVNLLGPTGLFETKYLSFQFNRVRVNKRVSHVLVTVMDRTVEVELERELEEAKTKAKGEVDSLVSILSIEKSAFIDFLDKASDGINLINEELKSSNQDHKAYMANVVQFQRIIHSIKGDASALDVSPVEKKTHEMEDVLTDIRNSDEITGNSFLPFTVKLDELFSQIGSLRLLSEQIANISDQHSDTAQPVTHSNTQSFAEINSLVKRVAEDENKMVNLVTQGLDSHHVPPAYIRKVREVAIQLVRNAVVHGIEEPNKRVELGKSPQGTVKASFQQKSDGNYSLTIIDDGAGLSVNRIKRHALQNDLVSEQDIEKMSNGEILNLIFQPGFSTASNVSMHAGRGVGLDVIKQSVMEAGGKMKLSYKQNKGCRFEIVLPGKITTTTKTYNETDQNIGVEQVNHEVVNS